MKILAAGVTLFLSEGQAEKHDEANDRYSYLVCERA